MCSYYEATENKRKQTGRFHREQRTPRSLCSRDFLKPLCMCVSTADVSQMIPMCMCVSECGSVCLSMCVHVLMCPRVSLLARQKHRFVACASFWLKRAAHCNQQPADSAPQPVEFAAAAAPQRGAIMRHVAHQPADGASQPVERAATAAPQRGAIVRHVSPQPTDAASQPVEFAARSKTAQRIVAAVSLLQKSDTRQEQMEDFSAMMRCIREESAAIGEAEADPVASLGKYVNEEARSGDALHLCVLVKKLRDVDTADRSTMLAFYTGMIEHAKGRKRLSADLPAEDAAPGDLIGSPYLNRWIRDSEAKLRLVQMLEGETRAKVSVCAADDLHQYVGLLEAKLKLVTAINKTHA